MKYLIFIICLLLGSSVGYLLGSQQKATQLAQLEKEVESTQFILDQKTENLEEQEQENQALQEELDSLQQELEQVSSSAVTEDDALQTTESDQVARAELEQQYQQDRDAWQQQQKKLQQQISALKSAQQQPSRVITRQCDGDKISTLTQQLAQMRTENSQLQKKLDDMGNLCLQTEIPQHVLNELNQ